MVRRPSDHSVIPGPSTGQPSSRRIGHRFRPATFKLYRSAMQLAGLTKKFIQSLISLLRGFENEGFLENDFLSGLLTEFRAVCESQTGIGGAHSRAPRTCRLGCSEPRTLQSILCVSTKTWANRHASPAGFTMLSRFLCRVMRPVVQEDVLIVLGRGGVVDDHSSISVAQHSFA